MKKKPTSARKEKPSAIHDEETIAAFRRHLAYWRKQETLAQQEFENAKEKLRSIKRNVTDYEKALQRMESSKKE